MVFGLNLLSQSIFQMEFFWEMAAGSFDYSSDAFNQALIISQIGISAFIFAGFFREYFLFKYPEKNKFTNN